MNFSWNWGCTFSTGRQNKSSFSTNVYFISLTFLFGCLDGLSVSTYNQLTSDRKKRFSLGSFATRTFYLAKCVQYWHMCIMHKNIRFELYCFFHRNVFYSTRPDLQTAQNFTFWQNTRQHWCTHKRSYVNKFLVESSIFLILIMWFPNISDVIMSTQRQGCCHLLYTWSDAPYYPLWMYGLSISKLWKCL